MIHHRCDELCHFLWYILAFLIVPSDASSPSCCLPLTDLLNSFCNHLIHPVTPATSPYNAFSVIPSNFIWCILSSLMLQGQKNDTGSAVAHSAVFRCVCKGLPEPGFNYRNFQLRFLGGPKASTCTTWRTSWILVFFIFYWHLEVQKRKILDLQFFHEATPCGPQRHALI